MINPELVHCQCCTDYITWKQHHSDRAKSLQIIADQPYYYKVCNEEFEIHGITYHHTIRALPGSTKGKCLQIASSTGPHPHICHSCFALLHGKTSQFLRKVQRNNSLKYPRGIYRVGKKGVTMKHPAREEIEEKVRSDKIAKFVDKRKISSLERQAQIHLAWRENENLRPFMEKMIDLFSDVHLSEFDCSFLSNWLGKKHKGRMHHADEQARSLAILLSNKLGEKLYSTVAPMMGLPSHRQAQRIRSKDMGTAIYLPGLNDWSFKIYPQGKLHHCR